MKNCIATLCLLLLTVSLSPAQQAVQQLKGYMAALRERSYPTVAKEVLQDTENAMALLQALEPYAADSVQRVRSAAYTLSRRIAKEHPQQEVRAKAVEVLLRGLKDAASQVVGTATSGLRHFSPADFTPVARERLLESFTPGVPHKGAIAKLLGYLQMEEAKPALTGILREGALGRSDKWAVYLALARMGDEEALDFTLSRVRRLSLNDDVVYDILPDLAYIRHPAAIAYLVEVLYSEEKSCQAADAELGGAILCGYRVMEMLAPLIKEYPLALDTSGDLATTDYEGALLQLRQWFRDHPDYEIITTTY